MRLPSHITTDDGFRLDGLVIYRATFGFPMDQLTGAAWVRYRGETVRLRRPDSAWDCAVWNFLIGGPGGMPVRWTP